jgi:hypothetical protein
MSVIGRAGFSMGYPTRSVKWPRAASKKVETLKMVSKTSGALLA